jgi:hypothetical protein
MEIIKELDIRDIELKIFKMFKMFEDNRLSFNADFQKKSKTWSHKQKSLFIESILLKLPLPPFYVIQNLEAKFIMFDGIQRANALLQYKNNEFQLQGLDILTCLNGKTFDDLKCGINVGFFINHVVIEDTEIKLHVLRNSMPMKIVLDIFNRINYHKFDN